MPVAPVPIEYTSNKHFYVTAIKLPRNTPPEEVYFLEGLQYYARPHDGPLIPFKGKFNYGGFMAAKPQGRGTIHAGWENLAYAPDNSPAALNPAGSRFMKAAKNDYDYHLELKWKQYLYFKLSREAREIREHLCEHFATLPMVTLLESMLIVIERSPKDKVKMRQRFYEDLLSGAAMKDWAPREQVAEAKLKREIAKWGKATRFYVSLGVKALMLTGWAAYMWKDALEREFIKPNFRAKFIKTPNQEVMNSIPEWFRQCAEGETRVVLFSDDALGVRRIGGNLYIIESDISSCDSSVGDAVYDWIDTFTSCNPVFEQQIKEATSQMKWPIMVRNPAQPLQKKYLYPRKRVLYSGSAITTVTDTTVNLCCWYNFANMKTKPKDISKNIELAFERAGFLCTADVNMDTPKGWASSSFLKHFFVELPDGWKAVPCLGVVMRSFGNQMINFKPTFKGKYQWDVEARRYLTGVVESYKHFGNYDFMNSLRKAFPPIEGVKENKTSLGFILSQCSDEVDDRYVPMELISLRYGLTQFEEVEMCQDAERMDVGIRYTREYCDKILEVDYGLPKPNRNAFRIPFDAEDYTHRTNKIAIDSMRVQMHHISRELGLEQTSAEKVRG